MAAAAEEPPDGGAVPPDVEDVGELLLAADPAVVEDQGGNPIGNESFQKKQLQSLQV